MRCAKLGIPFGGTLPSSGEFRRHRLATIQSVAVRDGKLDLRMDSLLQIHAGAHDDNRRADRPCQLITRDGGIPGRVLAEADVRKASKGR
jgi:hypothetical protein